MCSCFVPPHGVWCSLLFAAFFSFADYLSFAVSVSYSGCYAPGLVWGLGLVHWAFFALGWSFFTLDKKRFVEGFL
jgi:hypothetical protein